VDVNMVLIIPKFNTYFTSGWKHIATLKVVSKGMCNA
jgi:hypothetical protein